MIHDILKDHDMHSSQKVIAKRKNRSDCTIPMKRPNGGERRDDPVKFGNDGLHETESKSKQPKEIEVSHRSSSSSSSPCSWLSPLGLYFSCFERENGKTSVLFSLFQMKMVYCLPLDCDFFF